MQVVETVARIRREHFVKGKTIKEIARDLKVPEHGPQGAAIGGDLVRVRAGGPAPAEAGAMDGRPRAAAGGQRAKPAREQLTLIRIFEELRGRGYDGGYDAVRRYARQWSKERGQSTAAAYVPLRLLWVDKPKA
jgi:hypothetical protein